jgi:hypothetical protein
MGFIGLPLKFYEVVHVSINVFLIALIIFSARHSTNFAEVTIVNKKVCPCHT